MSKEPPGGAQPVNPLSVQVGGDHYKHMAIQPVEYNEANGLSFIEGSIIKYISRHRRKNGKQDLEKVIQFAQFQLHLVYPTSENPTQTFDRSHQFKYSPFEYAIANNLNARETAVVYLASTNRFKGGKHAILELIEFTQELIKLEYGI